MKTWVNRDAIVGKTIEACLINDADVILSFTDGTYWSGLINGREGCEIEDAPADDVRVEALEMFVVTGVISAEEWQAAKDAAREDQRRPWDDTVNRDLIAAIDADDRWDTGELGRDESHVRIAEDDLPSRDPE